MPPKRSMSDHLSPTTSLDTATIKLMIAQHMTNTLDTNDANQKMSPRNL